MSQQAKNKCAHVCSLAELYGAALLINADPGHRLKPQDLVKAAFEYASNMINVQQELMSRADAMPEASSEADPEISVAETITKDDADADTKARAEAEPTQPETTAPTEPAPAEATQPETPEAKASE